MVEDEGLKSHFQRDAVNELFIFTSEEKHMELLKKLEEFGDPFAMRSFRELKIMSRRFSKRR